MRRGGEAVGVSLTVANVWGVVRELSYHKRLLT